MHKILLPVDGSENALRAVDYVISLAKEVGPVGVLVVNVQEAPMVYGEVQVYMGKEEAERYRVMASERALAEAASRLKSAGVEHEVAALEGPIGPTIARHAEERGCDSIVMGTRGMTALGNIIMGSVANKVIHLTRLPVTLVK